MRAIILPVMNKLNMYTVERRRRRRRDRSVKRRE